jgi:AcrR family transcriptional regulator
MSVSVRPKLGRPNGDHGQRQRDVADALLKVLGERGFEKASTRAVAREAHCTTGVLSHYFRSKEDLVCTAVDLMFDWVEQATLAAMRNRDSVLALKIVLGISKGAKEPPFDFWAVWLQVLAKARHNRRLTQIVRKRHGRFRELLTQIVADGQERGQLRVDISADLLADHINAVTDGLGLMAPIETERLTRKRSETLLELSVAFARGPNGSPETTK